MVIDGHNAGALLRTSTYIIGNNNNEMTEHFLRKISQSQLQKHNNIANDNIRTIKNLFNLVKKWGLESKCYTIVCKAHRLIRLLHILRV